MKTDSPQTIYLSNYTAPSFLIDTVDLHIDLGEEWTTVKALLHIRRNPGASSGRKALVLDGQNLKLRSVRLDDIVLTPAQYEVSDSYLIIPDVPDSFALATEVAIQPQNNTALEGLYKSGSIFCTQCEAEGFRKITYFQDRPDVMSRYRTTISANPELYPVLLSNGNLADSGRFEDGRCWVKWEDPFPKPSYLFALVAGDLQHIEDKFTTVSGREVTLRIYVETENIKRCGHAIRSLKESMRWDEERFGREYDLDLFMIVAVNDFNMGAMENKGLNIFNSKLVLASEDTATDTDFYNVQAVIGHEYFHNWSGNRVTCRDWFQLSLKEGFTVFRDQEFSADLNSRAVQRIGDVNRLRTYQFPEDAGPLSHPVRPDSYMEINNFYTMTVYEKGAEVVRMIHNLLGKEAFRKGTDLYFERHDGQAVTCDDFVAAMEEANEVDLRQFKRWYSQAGTPELYVSASHNPEVKTYTLTVRQSCPDTPGQSGFGENQNAGDPAEKKSANRNEQRDLKKQAFHIPLAMTLLAPDGQNLPLKIQNESHEKTPETRVLELRKESETFVFEDISQPPIPSLLCGFSAPVKLHFDYSNADLAFLLANDTDEFNRWEAGQQLMIRVALEQIQNFQKKQSLHLSPELSEAFRNLLNQTQESDSSLLAQALSFPTESYLGEANLAAMATIDVDAVHAVRKFLRAELARELQTEFEKTHANLQESGSYEITPQAMGRRSLKNVCLGYLSELETPETRQLAQTQSRNSGNMTDVMGALIALIHVDCPERESALREFEQKWRDNPLVMDKWFSLQAASTLPETLSNVRKLKEHTAYNAKNPNKIRSLIGTFSQGNPFIFHAADGSGYEFLAAEVLALESHNPQVAARLVSAFNRWKKYDENRRGQMREQLEKIIKASNLSADVYEIVSKTLETI